MIDGFAEEVSQAVRLELLAAGVRLFFRRPAEMQAREHSLSPFPPEDACEMPQPSRPSKDAPAEPCWVAPSTC
jgi:hypothetical protein